MKYYEKTFNKRALDLVTFLDLISFVVNIQ